MRHWKFILLESARETWPRRDTGAFAAARARACAAAYGALDTGCDRPPLREAAGGGLRS